MPDQVALLTDRLHLRGWLESDREPFAQMNADAEVMKHFPSTLPRAESDALADRIKIGFSERGWGLWAVTVTKPPLDLVNPTFIGFVGLAIPQFDADFTPCVEIGWRLTRTAWGRGYATEAGHAVVQFAFEQLKLAEVVSFTASCNARSERVMQRLGMSHDAAEDFEHPNLPAGHQLRRHVLYRLRNVAIDDSDQKEFRKLHVT